MEIQSRGYDSTLGLSELLSGVIPDKLSIAINILLGAPTRVVSKDAKWVLGNPPHLTGNINRRALIHDLETVGFLETMATDDARIQAIANIMELLIRSGSRYFMASEMHIEVVKADFEELRRKHAALMASEARYKTLAENLELRVSEQVKTIESAHRQLYQAEKLASVGQLAAGVAHEINNPIGFIRSNLNTASSYIQKFQRIAEAVRSGDANSISNTWRAADLDFVLEDFPTLLQESIYGADRVARIVSDLKSFSNVDQADDEIVNLNDSICAACNMAASQINGRAELNLALGELPPLLCKVAHLNQLILNLLLNAVQSIKEHGTINVQSSVIDNQILISITDTGCGIPEEILPRIFDPFYTTHDVGSGTGLGLTVSRDIVIAHNGRIEVNSTVGKGSTFSVYLPIQQRPL